MKIRFQEVKLYCTKTGKCPKCGKQARRSLKLFQTRNPFNLNKDGLAKSNSEIIAELKGEREVWKTIPTFHAGCE